MTFCEELIRENMDLWMSSADLPFLDEMVHDTLDHRKFAHYLVQDTQYLAAFAKIYAYSFLKAEDLDVMRELYEEMGIIVAGETEQHIDYLRDAGIDPDAIMKTTTTRECGEYVDYMLKVSRKGTLAEGIFVSGPCNFSYYYLGLEIRRRMEAAGNYETNYFRPWLEYYIGEDYKAGCDRYLALCNRVSENLTAKEQKSIRESFRKCSGYEKEFWIMAYEGDGVC